MARLALLVSHDRPGGLPGTMDRLAEALVPFFDEVRWAVMSGSVNGPVDRQAGSSPGDAVQRVEWRLPQMPPVRGALLDWLTAPVVDLCAGWPQPAFDHALQEAALVVVQSGPSAALIERIRRRAQQADLVYLATTRLGPPEVHPRVKALLQRDALLIDRAVTTVRALLPELAIFGARAQFVPAGQDGAAGDPPGPSPGFGSNAVVLDFGRPDATVVQIAASMIPGTCFHLIGRWHAPGLPDNVMLHGPLPPEQVTRLLDAADIALVPDASDPPDTVAVSAVLDRLQHRGVPVVCPLAVAGDEPHRFGYETGRSASIRAALRLALQARQEPHPSSLPTWRSVALCVLGHPQDRRQPESPRRSEIRHAG